MRQYFCIKASSNSVFVSAAGFCVSSKTMSIKTVFSLASGAENEGPPSIELPSTRALSVAWS